MIPSGYSRTVFHGTLENGEIFQWGFWASEAPSDAAAANTQADAARDAFAATTSGSVPRTLLSTGSAYTGVRVYSYPNGGPDAEYVGESTITGQAGAGTGSLPNQVCVVATLLTGLAGRRNRGRIFLPCNSSSLANGQLSSSITGGIQAWVASFVGAINSAYDPGKVVVLSQVAGSASNVTEISVDSRLDIQRRRADRETELFTVSGPIA